VNAPKKMTDTQAIRNRQAMREAAERQARMIALAFVVEIVGFSVTIILELMR
jgi:hypothetical protein